MSRKTLFLVPLALFMLATGTVAVATQSVDNAISANERRDYGTAYHGFRRTAEQGHVKAQNEMGVMHALGRSVPADWHEAAKWFRLAAERGHADAQYNLGIMYDASGALSTDKPTKWLAAAAEQGQAHAQYEMGFTYIRGADGVLRDSSKAAEWFRLAAKQGHVDAQYNLGRLYLSGEGISQNTSKAAKWFRLAAEQDHSRAQYSLGRLYLDGEGVTEDYSKAAEHLGRAALMGIADARYYLGRLKIGDNSVQNYVLAARQFQILVTSEELTGLQRAKAQYHLGNLYYRGQGMVQDYSLAHKWFNLAASTLPGGPVRDIVVDARDEVAKFIPLSDLLAAQRLATEWQQQHPPKSYVLTGRSVGDFLPLISSYESQISPPSLIGYWNDAHRWPFYVHLAPRFWGESGFPKLANDPWPFP